MFKLGDRVMANTPAILKEFSNTNQPPAGVIGTVYSVINAHEPRYLVKWVKGGGWMSNGYSSRHLISVNFKVYYEQIELHR